MFHVEQIGRLFLFFTRSGSSDKRGYGASAARLSPLYPRKPGSRRKKRAGAEVERLRFAICRKGFTWNIPGGFFHSLLGHAVSAGVGRGRGRQGPLSWSRNPGGRPKKRAGGQAERRSASRLTRRFHVEHVAPVFRPSPGGRGWRRRGWQGPPPLRRPYTKIPPGKKPEGRIYSAVCR